MSETTKDGRKRFVTIGADELIYWMRKNGICTGANHQPNDWIGHEIRPIMERLGGTLVQLDRPVDWPLDPMITNADGLPQTAAQYRLPISSYSFVYASLIALDNRLDR